MRNLNRSDTAFCMSVLAAGDLLSRLTLPSLTDHFRMTSRNIFLAGCAMLLVARSTLALLTDRSALLIMCGTYGVVRAATIVNQGLVVADYVGNGRGALAGALGLSACSRGACVLAIGQVLGWIRDATGSYALCLHAQNALLVIVLFAWSTERWMVACKR